MVDVDGDEYKAHLAATGHKLAKLTISTAEKTADIHIELFTDLVPDTCNKFLSLCGNGYAGLNFERVLRGGFIQTGKLEGAEVFPDESFAVPYSEGYTVGMSNEGAHTNSGQFFITLGKAPYLSAKYVAFGKVVSGTDMVDSIGELECTNERPVGKCVIDSAGEC
mmetsp:Transcript_19870/g.41474  ORF Transcript_19870/g.41474 Transcript_19870/m.41474 type:complete len:165 (-) Transcript_19870:53-547(-)